MCEFIITSDKEFFETIGEEETKRYFQTAYDFVSQYKGLGDKYILSPNIHNDESTPHMHIVFVPVVHTKDKTGKEIDKIACSEYWKGKDSYKRLQDEFYKYITDRGFDLERGKTRDIEHLSTEKLKQITNYDNIKYEITHEQIKPLDTDNIYLIQAQNKSLIKYCNKLKLYLSQSIQAIDRLNNLEQENINLKIENRKLKNENLKLKDYIEKTFEVVKNIFNFPIDKFKNIINTLSSRFL